MGSACAVILLNMGGPESLADVRPFLYNLFSDREIIRLGPVAAMQRPLALLISTLRAPKSRGYYRLIGGGSPLLRITSEQAGALRTRLREHGDYRVYSAMRYCAPRAGQVLDQAISDGAERVVSLTMYPHYSTATTGSSERDLESAIRRAKVPYVAVSEFHRHPLYLDALVSLIRPQLGPDTHILYSAHSLPRKFIDEGDPYERQLRACIDGITEKLRQAEGRERPHWLGFQSRSGPVKWLEPPTERVIADMAAAGVRNALAVPISFVSDHIETLYEIDILYKHMAADMGIELRRTESLNTHPLFIRALEDLVLKKVREAGWA